MLTYVAAIATAVTLTMTISPVAPSTKEGASRKEKANWTQHIEKQSIEIQRKIEVSGPRALYVLSREEQAVFRKALLASVRVVSSGKRIA